MFSYARAYAYLLFAESRPAPPAAAEPLDSLLTRLVSAPVESFAWRGRDRSAEGDAPSLRVVPCVRDTTTTRPPERLRPAA